MTLSQWITLVIAILGVLHGPLAVRLFSRTGKTKAGK